MNCFSAALSGAAVFIESACKFYQDVLYLKNKSISDRMYYSKIWGRTADWLGGVDRNNYDDFWTKSNFVPW